MDLKNKKILLTGGSGFVGQHIYQTLLERNCDPKNIVIPRSSEFDLRDAQVCSQLVKDSEIVIHAAGNVGGIGYNLDFPGTLFYDNLLMGLNLIEEARKYKIEKFVQLGTVCAYPKFTPLPFKEEDLWNGFPEETNAPYGIAKKALLVMLQSYRDQYGLNGIFLLPVNMYGPGDNFDPKSSHVISALIRKIFEAKRDHKESIEVWGDGSASREFLFAEDAAEGIVLATENYEKPDPVNIGSGMEITIKDLVILLTQLMNYQGEIHWDTTKPNGQPRRMLDVSRAEKEFGFKAKVSFVEGLKKTIVWFEQNNQ